MQTREVTFSSGGRNFKGFAAIPDGGGGPGVVVLHAWWGLTPFFRRFCERLAAEGFTTFAPDLYGGKTAHTVEEAERMMQASDESYARAASLGALQQIKHLPGVHPDCLGVVGFSMGAAWTLALSANVPDEVAAAVLFYGSNPVDFHQVRAAVMGHFSEQDEWEPLDGIHMMEADLEDAGREYTFHYYAGAGHWFMEDDKDAYNQDAADLAWQRTIEFLREKLTPASG
jgi:carboxymethylenebutenolidase